MNSRIKWFAGTFVALVATLILTVSLSGNSESSYSLEELVKEEKDFFLVIGSDICSFCQEYKQETLNGYSEEKMGVPLVEIDWFKITEEEQNELKEKCGIEIEVTPTTYFFEKGKLKETKAGVLSMDDLKEMMK